MSFKSDRLLGSVRIILQVIANFEIGRRIVEHEQQGSERAEYGKALLKELSKQLCNEFGRGFAERNLDYMRKFYLLYQNRFGKISQMPSAKFRALYKGEGTALVSAKLCEDRCRVPTAKIIV